MNAQQTSVNANVVHFTVVHDKGNKFNFFKETWHAVSDFCPMPEYLQELGHCWRVDALSEVSEQDAIETLKQNIKGYGLSGVLRRTR